MAASANSSYVDTFDFPGRYAPVASFELLRSGVEEAERMGVRHHVGNLYSSDLFYADMKDVNVRCAKMGVMAVEMEAAALYMIAAKAKKKALCVCTVSNHMFTKEELSTEERQLGFNEMIKLCLEIA
jgi:purine-nucleoside phosphorylase